MRKMNRFYGVGILILLVSMVLMSGCCARLQSPIVFENCCGYSSCGYGGGSMCGSSCNSCCPAPCDPSYR
ncbi:MAG: hypothetical protein DYH02_12985 [Candidatus Omnitrophica bacterium COP1]|nr:hypothetical protein [Candidatus Omnitrophota bacterium]MCE7909260.1 hypothetical protein [Candidatus Omnitrophica bacterium COP1]